MMYVTFMMAIGCVFFLKMCIFVLDELKLWNNESKIKTFAVSKDIGQSEFLAEFATFEVQFLVYMLHQILAVISCTLYVCNIL